MIIKIEGLDNALLAAIQRLTQAINDASANLSGGARAFVALSGADTIEQDVAKVETDAKAAQQKAMEKVSTGKAEIAAALERAKAEKEAAKPAPAVEEEKYPIGEPAELDSDKDVRPALLAVGKDRDALVKLMGKYEVPKGGKAPAEKWADLLAEANAIVAARG